MRTKTEGAGIIPEKFRNRLVSNPSSDKNVSLEIRISIAGIVVCAATIPSPECPTALFMPDLLTAIKNSDPIQLIAFLLNKGWHASPNSQIAKMLS